MAVKELSWDIEEMKKIVREQLEKKRKAVEEANLTLPYVAEVVAAINEIRRLKREIRELNAAKEQAEKRLKSLDKEAKDLSQLVNRVKTTIDSLERQLAALAQQASRRNGIASTRTPTRQDWLPQEA